MPRLAATPGPVAPRKKSARVDIDRAVTAAAENANVQWQRVQSSDAAFAQCVACCCDGNEIRGAAFHKCPDGHVCCEGCIAECVRFQSKEGGGVLPKCPGCTNVIPGSLMRSAAEEDATKLLRLAALAVTPSARASPKCGVPLLRSRNCPDMLCPDCNCAFCFHHDLRHGSDACVVSHCENPFRSAASCIWKRVRCQKCPGCHRFVQRNGGCPYMTCNCGTHFCWVCGVAEPQYEHTGSVWHPTKGCQTAIMWTARLVGIPVAGAVAVALSPLALLVAGVAYLRRRICK